MKEEKPKVDFLDALVSREIEEVKNIGPTAVDILRFLALQSGPVDIRSFAQKLIEAQKSLLLVRVEMLNLRSTASVDAPVVKSVPATVRLVALDEDVDAKIGVDGQWLRVADMDGSEGFVLAHYVARLESGADLDARIRGIMEVLERLQVKELVRIFPYNDGYAIELCERGRYLTDAMKLAA